MFLSICLQPVMMCIYIQVLWKPEWIQHTQILIIMFLLQALFIGYLQNSGRTALWARPLYIIFNQIDKKIKFSSQMKCLKPSVSTICLAVKLLMAFVMSCQLSLPLSYDSCLVNDSASVCWVCRFNHLFFSWNCLYGFSNDYLFLILFGSGGTDLLNCSSWRPACFAYSITLCQPVNTDTG